MEYALVLFAQSPPDFGLPEQTSGLVVIYVISDDPVNDHALAAARIPKPSFYLLWPDGHIGLAGAEMDTTVLVSYLDERVNLPKVSITRDKWD